MNKALFIAAQCRKQQELTGRVDATVSLVIPGKWPKGGRKRLAGKSGPLGHCVSENDNSVVCLFAAHEVLAFLAPLLVSEGEPHA